MADDLGDEWWKDSDDNDDSADPPQDKGPISGQKRGVKRQADQEDHDDSDSDDSDKKTSAKKTKSGPAQQKADQKKKKKKKGSRKFVRKKITDLGDDELKKSGTPADVQALLKPTVAVLKSDESPVQPDSKRDSDDDDDNDDDDDAALSTDSDFWACNRDLPPVDYLQEVLPGWQEVVKESKPVPGSPFLLVLCSSAIRAVQLNRDLKPFLGKECKTAKLFAKHMKLEEQKDFLGKKACHASIGTPNRVQALLEAGSLKLNHLHALVLDWNWRDVKLKRMADIPDVRRDLSVLLKEHAVEHITHSPCRIAVL